MKLRNVAVAFALLLALVVARPGEAKAGVYISFGSYGHYGSSFNVGLSYYRAGR